MNIIEAFLGLVTVLSFIVTVLLTVTIRRYVDPELLKGHPDVQQLFTTQLLPREVLLPVGRRLWFWRNVIFIVFLLSVLIIIVWQQVLK